MADNTIDTLELQVVSNANKASASLDGLVKKLLEVNHSFAVLNSGMRKYAKEIGTVGAAVKAFSNIKIKMPEISGMTKEVDRMEKYVSNASRKIAQSFSDAFNINGSDLSSIQKRTQEIGSLLSSGKSGAASNLVDSLGESIIKAASNTKYMDDEMQAFYQTLLKVGKIKVSPGLPKALPDEWKNMDGLLRQKMSTQTGTELDSLMQEWKANFKGLFSGLDTDTVEDQFVTINNLVKQCREGIADPLANSGLLEDAVWEKVTSELGNFEKGIKNTKAALEASGGTKETQNLGLDKFIADIRKLSNVNTEGLSGIGDSLSGLAKGISDLNGKSIDINPVMQAVNMIKQLGEKKNVTGTDHLRQISSNLQEFANSINSIEKLTSALTSLGEINFDSNNLSKVINSLKNLLSVKMEGFDASVFPKIAESIGTLSNVPDVSNSLNRFIASLAKLAGTGPSITTVANQLPNLGVAIKTAVEKIASVGNVSESVNAFVQSIAHLASAGAKTGQTASGLSNLAEETSSFFETMAKAPKISQNTIAMTKALAELASSGGKASNAASTITGAFNRLSGLGGKSANAIRRAASSIVSSFKSIGSGSKHLNTASFGFGRFIKSVLPYATFYQLFNWGKQAVKLSSDLTEVQNVVDVTFGNMSDKVEEFTKNSIQQFGMSELSAKQFASRFQAMGSAMGIDKSLIGAANDYLEGQTRGYVGASDAMADMSLNLTKLTADMASFYNVEQKAVAEDLESIFTGQTRPLRAYGLDLTQATLQEWALKQGIDANIQSMSQAEKTMLRYQYVLANTTAAHSDFSRTAGSWANQVRILVQSFQQLGSIVGRTLINAFKPFVATLNTVMQKVITFAETVSEALGAIFGWKIEIGGGGVTNDLGDISDDMGDIADGTDDASDAAQKLKKSLSVLPFDQLNQLAADAVRAGNGGSGGGAGSGDGTGAGSGASAAIVPSDSILKRYESEIKNLEQLGEYIGDALIKAMQGIDWDKVYSKAQNFGTGLADFLNGLISPDLFYHTGRLVANSLNTALHALDSFGETFEWDNFGDSLANGINGALLNFNVYLAADTFTTWANGILTSLEAGAERVQWDTIGDKVATFIKNSLGGINWNTAYSAASGFGSGLASFLNRLITPETFGEIGHTIAGGLKTALSFGISFISTFDWYNATISLSTALTTFITDVSWKYLAKVFGFQMKRALRGIKNGIADTDWNEIGQKIHDFIVTIPFAEILSDIGELIWEAINSGLELAQGIFGIDIIEDKVNDLDKELNLSTLSNGIKTLGEALSPFVKGFAQGFIDVMDFLANTVTPAIISALGTAFEALGNALKAIPPEVMQELGESLGGIGAALITIKGASVGISALKGLFSFLGGTKTATDVAKGGLENVGKAAGGTSKATGILQTIFSSTGGKMAGMISAIVYGGVKLNEFADAAQGGNGELSELGGIMDNIRTQFAPGLSDEIFRLKEELENSGATSDEAKDKFIELFTKAGVSADTLSEKFINVAANTNVTAEQEELLRGIIDGLAQSSENAAAKVEASGELTSSAYDRIRQAIKELGDESGFYGEDAYMVLDALQQQEESGNNAKTAFQYLLDMYGNIEVGSGTLADALNGKLKGSFDNIGGTASTASTNIGNVAGALFGLSENSEDAEQKGGLLSTMLSGLKDGSWLTQAKIWLLSAASKALGDSADTASVNTDNLDDSISGLDTSGASSKIRDLNEQLNSLAENSKDAGDNWTEGLANGITNSVSILQNGVKSITDTLISDTQTQLGEHSPSTISYGFGVNWVQGFINGHDSLKNTLLSNVADFYENIKGKFGTSKTDFAKIATDIIFSLSSGLNDYSPVIKATSSIKKSIEGTFKGFSLYSYGRSAAQSFANGISSVHIPMPHISVDASTYKTDSGYSYNMSSWVNWYKSGGLFGSPAVIGIGEAGREAVLPLESPRAMSRIANSITDNMDGGFGLSKDEMRQAVAEGVAMAMMNNQDNRPINLYATLYTENDEVLARAVTRGQEKIDYRMKPTPSYG